MNKQTITKIISGLILFVFVMFIFQYSYTAQAADFANTGVLSDLYSNPNKNNGDNPYKFALSSVLRSGMIQQVVGCTGVVNKVSTWMSKFVQSPKQQAKMAMAETAKIREQLKNACASVKAGAESGAGAVPLVNNLPKAVGTLFAKIKAGLPGGGDVKICQDQVDITSEEMIEAAVEEEKRETENALKDQCLDGIALTLARNQLTAMTRSAMNWVNTGYGGNPFFVQNMRNFTEGIERNVVETGIDVLLAPNGQQSPYARDFARSTIASRGILSSSSGFLGGLQSNLQNFITDPSSYYSDKSLDKTYDTMTALQQAQEANNAFSRSFMSGGWEGWLAFTQTPQNNPLGFNMLASQYLADQQAQQLQETRDELAQNNGFLSQKTCVKWQLYNKDGSAKTKNYSGLTSDTNGVSVRRPDGTLKTREELEKESKLQLANSTEFAFSTTEPQYGKIDGEHEFGKCVDWKITTPGSIIRDKTTNYLNSPERQLELAKTINDSLNALFSVLISKLQGGGLSGLSDSAVTTNWTDSINEVSTSYDGNTPYDNNGAYDGFNLTRDLGNTYIHDTLTPLGKWNAKDNCLIKGGKTTCPTEPKEIERLYPDLAPGYYDDENKFHPYNNAYYTVAVAGKTKLILEGHNGWEIGDRAFWDGTKWQNWKKGQTSPIKIRGVVQIQQDYIVSATEILKVLPTVMTNLGELDYCLPGPNPSYKSNSTNAQSAYQDWIGSMYVGPLDEYRTEWRIDHEDSRTYKNLAGIFADNQNTWKAVLSSPLMYLLDGFDRKWGTTACRAMRYKKDGSDWTAFVSSTCQSYHYKPQSSGDEQDDIDERKELMETTLDKVNNTLFQNFYRVFDAQMDNVYFKNMTSMYDDTEKRIGLDKNPDYVSMAESGFDLTKNITYYDDDIKKVTKEYNDAISQAKINIAKLEPIKSEVSGIIKAAQDRRDAKLLEQINKVGTDNPLTKARTAICTTEFTNCIKANKVTVGQCSIKKDECIKKNERDLTTAEYKAVYASCLEEENISFFDPDDITGMKDTDEENCIDGIDNDLDGFTDGRDSDDCPATPNSSANEGTRGPANTGGSGYRR